MEFLLKSSEKMLEVFSKYNKQIVKYELEELTAYSGDTAHDI